MLHISTTFVDIEDRIHGLEGGADGYLTDVLEPLELIATVKALLRARRAEEAAQISTRQWQVTFDAINDGVVLLDRDGRAVQINSAMEGILGKPWNDLSGRTIHDLLSVPADPERLALPAHARERPARGRRADVGRPVAPRHRRSDPRRGAASSRAASASPPTSRTAGDWRRS